MKATLSVYNCLLGRVIDGDTFVCTGDVRAVIPDAKIWSPHVRVAGIDTPERTEPGWAEARTRATGWLEVGPFNLICFGRDKYGRLLADAERGEGLFSQYMLANEYARSIDLIEQLVEA